MKVAAVLLIGGAGVALAMEQPRQFVIDCACYLCSYLFG